MLSSDSGSDVHPPSYVGLRLLDHVELDGRAQACAQEDGWTFFVSAALRRFRGATGSSVKPLAIFSPTATQ
jgi:hypothetical protein